jgi:hypothetical protein
MIWRTETTKDQGESHHDGIHVIEIVVAISPPMCLICERAVIRPKAISPRGALSSL